MKLRHLRYFVAVLQGASLTMAAARRLHASQPSLSRQIRELGYQVGTEMLSRSVHGVELTATSITPFRGSWHVLSLPVELVPIRVGAALMLIAPCFYCQWAASRGRDATHPDSRRRICGTAC
jgi:hypothetical protein